MAVVKTTTIHTFVALAADTKPTVGVPAGSRLWETDTGSWFLYDGSAWTHESPQRSSVTTLINGTIFDDDPTSENSSNVDVSEFRKFLLFLDIDSTLTPTDIQFIIQFSDDGGTTYYDYLQGPFASLFFEDTVVGSGIKVAFSGECVGTDLRLRVVGTGTDATNFFTVTAKIQLMD